MSVNDAPSPIPERSYSRRILLFALIGLCLLFVGSYTRRLNQRAQVDDEIAKWELRVEQAQQKQLALQAELEYVTTNDYVDEVARERFGMAKEGDTVIVVLTATPAPAPTHPVATPAAVEPVSAPRVQENRIPYWQQWLSIFAPDRSD